METIENGKKMREKEREKMKEKGRYERNRKEKKVRGM